MTGTGSEGPHETVDDQFQVLGYIESGAVRPLLAGTYRLSQFHDAQRAFMAKGFVGNLVVVPDARWDEVGAPHAA